MQAKVLQGIQRRLDEGRSLFCSHGLCGLQLGLSLLKVAQYYLELSLAFVMTLRDAVEAVP